MKQGSDMMGIFCRKDNSFSNGKVGWEKREIGGRKTS